MYDLIISLVGPITTGTNTTIYQCAVFLVVMTFILSLDMLCRAFSSIFYRRNR